MHRRLVDRFSWKILHTRSRVYPGGDWWGSRATWVFPSSRRWTRWFSPCWSPLCCQLSEYHSTSCSPMAPPCSASSHAFHAASSGSPKGWSPLPLCAASLFFAHKSMVNNGYKLFPTGSRFTSFSTCIHNIGGIFRVRPRPKCSCPSLCSRKRIYRSKESVKRFVLLIPRMCCITTISSIDS